jgi:hypothetical protein
MQDPLWVNGKCRHDCWHELVNSVPGSVNLRLARQSHAENGQTLKDAGRAPEVDHVLPRSVDEGGDRVQHDVEHDCDVKTDRGCAQADQAVNVSQKSKWERDEKTQTWKKEENKVMPCEIELSWGTQLC